MHYSKLLAEAKYFLHLFQKDHEKTGRTRRQYDNALPCRLAVTDLRRRLESYCASFS